MESCNSQDGEVAENTGCGSSNGDNYFQKLHEENAWGHKRLLHQMDEGGRAEEAENGGGQAKEGGTEGNSYGS